MTLLRRLFLCLITGGTLYCLALFGFYAWYVMPSVFAFGADLLLGSVGLGLVLLAAIGWD